MIIDGFSTNIKDSSDRNYASFEHSSRCLDCEIFGYSSNSSVAFQSAQP